MKVLFLIPASYPDGSATAKLIQRLAVGLEAAGVASEVLCFEKSSSAVGKWRRDKYGISYYGVPIGSTWLAKRLTALSLARKFQAEVRHAVDQRGVTHVWVYNPTWLLWRHVVCFCYHSNTFVVAHLTEWWRFKFHLRIVYFDQQMFLRYCWPQLDGVIGISSPWVKFAQQCKVPAIQVPVPCPVSTLAVYNEGRRSPRKDYAFTLFYSGQLYRRDMPDVMLGALRKALRSDCPIKMIVAGKTDVWPEGRAFRRQVALDPQLRARVTITGYLSDAEFEEHVAAADAFLLLHDDSWESRACFPTRLGEYLLTGKPVIVSGVGDIPQYLRNGIDAVLLSPRNNEEELALAIERLVNNPEFAEQLGATGRARALELFSAVKLGAQLNTFLSSLPQKSVRT